MNQPALDPTIALLHSGYVNDYGLVLDLYGTLDADGYDVLDVTLHGSQVALNALVSNKQFDRMSAWCNDNLPPPIINKRKEIAAAYNGYPLYFD